MPLKSDRERELDAIFQVTGYYYMEQNYCFRSFLHIRKQLVGVRRLWRSLTAFLRCEKPDLMVVMMNPGGSVPVNGNDDGREEVSAEPDKTQYQIMEVMDAGDFNFARILNLSDLRDATSSKFIQQLATLDASGIEHSIFFRDRSAELNRLYVQSVPVILAWGVDAKLESLATLALNYIRNPKILGQKKAGNSWAYFHARRRNVSPKRWVNDILRQI